MFSNILARLPTRLPSHQQVRFVRQTYRSKYAYGIDPLVTDDDYQAAVDEGRIESLQFEKVRFAMMYESPSVLHDDDLVQFAGYVMKDGRRDLAEKLMHNAFYCVKSIQFMRKRKLETAKEKEGESSKNADGVDGDEEQEEVEMNPLAIFKKAVQNSQPIVVTKKVKRGGATYQVPFPLTPNESEYLAIKWLIRAVLDRPKPRVKHFDEVMAQELLDAAAMRGKVIKRKDDMHKLADANKAYAHYRWG